MSEKVILKATIPVVSYGNIQPEVEVEADTYEEAVAIAESRITDLWNKYADQPLPKGNTKRIKAFVGGEVDYDAETHTYSWNGETYLSASQYAKQFEKPFDVNDISNKMAAKFNVDAEEVRQMWKLKAGISTGLGTAIHEALELYGRFRELAIALDKTTNLHDHPIVKKAVEDFYAAHKEKAEYEVVVVDHKNKKAGRIDRLVILNEKEKRCRVEDYKTNAVLTPEKLEVYWKQMEFYGDILITNGWIIDRPIIHHWDGTWKEIKR